MLNFELSESLILFIHFLLIIIAIKLIISKDIFDNIIISSIFSLLSSISYILLDAPDVALTETSINVFLSTSILLVFLKKIQKFLINEPNSTTKSSNKKHMIIYIILTIFVILVIIFGNEINQFGEANSPIFSDNYKYYINNIASEIGVNSFVAAILASYRGFDTLCETIVILIAGISILLISSKNK
jgi:multicomponent Na+:H+ antiporter subunit B